MTAAPSNFYLTVGDRLNGPTWIQVSTELLAELGEWSQPLQVKVVKNGPGHDVIVRPAITP